MKKISRHVQDEEEAKRYRADKDKPDFTMMASNLLASAGTSHYLQVRRPTVARTIEWAAEAKTTKLRIAVDKGKTVAVTIAKKNREFPAGSFPADITDWIYRFSVPEEAEQEKIAACLTALDTQITEQSALLEYLKAHKLA